MLSSSLFTGEGDYGWRDMASLPQFTTKDEGVFTYENEEYDDIELALSDVSRIVNIS